MDDFSDYETAQYHKADPISNTVSDYVYCTIDVLWFSLKVFIFAGFELLKNAFYWLFNKSEPKSISGQLALITGSANGLGREIAIKLASDGCNVAIVDLDLLNAKRTVQTITGLFDVKCKAFKCDVSKFEDVQNLKDEVEKSFGTSVDILVNNAGLLPHMSLETVTPNDIQKIINVNLMSQIWVKLCNRKLNIILTLKLGKLSDRQNFCRRNDQPETRSHCGNLFNGRKDNISFWTNLLCIKIWRRWFYESIF